MSILVFYVYDTSNPVSKSNVFQKSTEISSIISRKFISQNLSKTVFQGSLTIFNFSENCPKTYSFLKDNLPQILPKMLPQDFTTLRTFLKILRKSDQHKFQFCSVAGPSGMVPIISQSDHKKASQDQWPLIARGI